MRFVTAASSGHREIKLSGKEERHDYNVLTATIALGKIVEALAFAHEIAKLVERLAGVTVGVSVPVGGNPFRIARVSMEPSLAAVDATWAKLMGSADFMKALEGAAALFLPGLAHDEMWRSLEI